MDRDLSDLLAEYDHHERHPAPAQPSGDTFAELLARYLTKEN